jgi:2-polyprenyl-3-methyl-5-hydroxy-6-metoxy-1,4-benzoquinol methylase
MTTTIESSKIQAQSTEPAQPAQPVQQAETVDQAAVQAFAGRFLGILNDAALALSISVAHRTGLFDAMSVLPPSTSSQIAASAGLQERYVRECLAALVTGRIVDYAPEAGTYALPPVHAACLTRAAGPHNLGSIAQFIAVLGSVEDGIVESFRNGGGVPYSAYARFQQVMADESGQVFDATLVDITLPLVPGLVERLQQGIDVVDVGCGSGHAVNLMAAAFPNSRFTGYDFSADAIAVGRAEAARLGLTNARFEVQDVAAIDASTRYDLITAFDAIHDQAHPDRVLAAISEALRPGGTFLMVDIAGSSKLEENLDHPLGSYLYTVSNMHCMTVSLAQGGAGLGTMWGEQQALRMLADAGFARVDVEHVPGDIINSYYIARKD